MLMVVNSIGRELVMFCGDGVIALALQNYPRRDERTEDPLVPGGSTENPGGVQPAESGTGHCSSFPGPRLTPRRASGRRDLLAPAIRHRTQAGGRTFRQSLRWRDKPSCGCERRQASWVESVGCVLEDAAGVASSVKLILMGTATPRSSGIGAMCVL